MQIPKYLSEVRRELSKVTWPTRKEATRMTVIVIIASLLVGLYIGGLDLVFTSLLGLFIK
ncbi:MAG: preprotein translocase subunit SecE [bacterium]